jgi:hypothetical protein
MREPGNLHPPPGLRRRPRPRPRIWAERSVRVATRKALRSPKEHGLIVSPRAWRGAALQDGSSIGWYQAAPGNDPTPCFAHRVYTGGGYNRPIELPHLETFPGAACYQPIELPGYKAAPLQRSARSTRGLFSTLPSSFLILQRSGVFWVTRPRLRSHEAFEVRSVRVVRPVRIAPRDRGVGDGRFIRSKVRSTSKLAQP